MASSREEVCLACAATETKTILDQHRRYCSRIQDNQPGTCGLQRAHKTRRFLESNDLQLIGTDGPPSGQSTTVTYTYEFLESNRSTPEHDDSWKQLRGTLKDVFAELGGGEAYLRAERGAFYSEKEGE